METQIYVIAFFVLAAVASLADIETTRAILKRGGSESDLFGIYGHFPSAIRLYLVGGIALGLAGIFAILPMHYGDAWAACVVSGVLASVRTLGAVSNYLNLRRKYPTPVKRG